MVCCVFGLGPLHHHRHYHVALVKIHQIIVVVVVLVRPIENPGVGVGLQEPGRTNLAL